MSDLDNQSGPMISDITEGKIVKADLVFNATGRIKTLSCGAPRQASSSSC